MILVLFFIGLVRISVAQDFKNCDYYQDLFIGAEYEVFSPGYDGNYQMGTNCRWAAEAPPGYKIELNCDDISMLWVILMFGIQ
jgi:hypothetical protein